MTELFGERSRFSELEPMGVIDIGSNSVRLVVYEGAVRAPTPLFNEKVLCGLGRSVASTGHLGEESTKRALAALRRFRALARVLGVKNLRAIATAAVRDAKDGQAFIREGERAVGVRIEIVSGEKEARLAAYGIQMGFPDADGLAGDLGGGSLELIDVTSNQVNEATTLPLGGLRLLDETQGSLDAAKSRINDVLDNLPWLANGKGRPFYVVGGTWRALAKLHMAHENYPLHVMHGYEMSTQDAIRFAKAVVDQKNGLDFSLVSKARREIIPYGALVLERLLKKMAPSKVIFSIFGIREGLLYSLMPPTEQKRDPLIAFCQTFARLRSRSVEHAFELCSWTDRLFETSSIEETLAERRLRHAACLVSDVGWRAHPDYRGEQSLNMVAHAALAGIDHPGRFFLALAIYFRHAGKGESAGEHLSQKLKSTVSPELLLKARLVGQAVRVAHMLSAGMPGVIDETPLEFKDGNLVLHLPKAHAGLAGERIDRRLATLAGSLGCESTVRIAGN